MPLKKWRSKLFISWLTDPQLSPSWKELPLGVNGFGYTYLRGSEIGFSMKQNVAELRGGIGPFLLLDAVTLCPSRCSTVARGNASGGATAGSLLF